MKKQLVLLCMLLLLMVFTGCATQPVSTVVSDSTTGSSSSNATSSSTNSAGQKLEVMPDVYIEFLHKDIAKEIEEPENVPRSLQEICMIEGTIYYVAQNKGTAYIMAKQMETGQEQVVYQGSELIKGFIILDEQALLVAHMEKNSEHGGYNEKLYHYEINTGALTSVQDKYGVTEQYTHGASWANNTLLIDMYTPGEDFTGSYALYQILPNADVNRFEITKDAKSSSNYWTQIDGSNIFIFDNGIVSVINSMHFEPKSLFIIPDNWRSYNCKIQGNYLYLSLLDSNVEHNRSKRIMQLDIKTQKKTEESWISHSLFNDYSLRKDGYWIIRSEMENRGSYSVPIFSQLTSYGWDGEEENVYSPFLYPEAVPNELIHYDGKLYYVAHQIDTNAKSLAALEPVIV